MQRVGEVYFDDFKVEHIKSPVIESSDYFPFGLTFNNYRRENSLSNQIKFQGQEHQDELDLGWDAFKWRNHQPEIGRFFNLDPLSEKYYYNSPYAFSENKVIAHRELEGLESDPVNKEKDEPLKLSGPDAGVNEKGEPYAHVVKGEVKIKDKDGEFNAEATVLGGKMDTKSAELGKDGLSTGVIEANATTIGVKVETQLGSDQNNVTVGFSVDGPSADGKAGVSYTKQEGLDAGLGGTAQLAKQGVQLSFTIGGHQIGINGTVYEGAIGGKASVTGNGSGFGANVRGAFLLGLGVGFFYNKK